MQTIPYWSQLIFRASELHLPQREGAAACRSGFAGDPLCSLLLSFVREI
jgi:hypothetical protein